MSRPFWNRTPARPELRAASLPPLNGSSSDLNKRTTAGFAWLLLQTVLCKVVGLSIRTRLLSPSDFGLFTVAYAITPGVGWMQEAGTREMLVRRPKHYERRANSAFWLAVLIAPDGCAQQTLFLLSNNINSVLLPALSSLNLDHERQLRVYLRATRALAVGGALLGFAPSQIVPLALVSRLFPRSALAALLFPTVLGTPIHLALLRTFAPALWGDVLLKSKRNAA